MGKKAPRRGSMEFWHRQRARKLVPNIRTYLNTGKAGLVGFSAYKAGMESILMIEDSESPLKNQEVVKAVTVLETPPMLIYGISCYKQTFEGLKKFAEIVIQQSQKELKRAITPSKKTKMKIDLESKIPEIAEVRVIAVSQPFKANLKKTPEILEIPISGKDTKEKLEYAKSVLGKEIKASDILKEGEYIDVIAVTKGKGWQGVVKRYGVSLNIRKASKSRRHGGSIGGERQAKVFYTIPRAGQMGFQRRTELNKRILKISSERLFSKGFNGYGKLNTEFLILEGSIPGSKKRFITFRKSLRKVAFKKPQILKIFN